MFNSFTDFNFDVDPFETVKSFGHTLRRQNTYAIAPVMIPIIAAGITAVGGIMSGLAASRGTSGGGTSGKIRNNTVSGNAVSAQDFLFDVEAVKSMQDLTTQMNEWSGQDREFFKNTYEPFQESLIQANQELLPSIINNSGTALEQNMQDMFDSTFLKDAFREQALSAGENISKFSQQFADQVDKIPTAEQRIGQAISGVEQRFGQAGAELKRQMGAKGLDVSEAGIRSLMIGKASAKAGAAQQAGESARRELLDANATATGVFSSVQQSQASLLATERGLVQSGANLIPQIGGVQDNSGVSVAGSIDAQLTAAAAGKQLGTASEKKDATFTQKGIQVPKFFDKDTGNVVTGSGEDVLSQNLQMQQQLAKAMQQQKAALEMQAGKGGGVVDNSILQGGGPGIGASGPGSGEEGSSTGGVVGGGTGESMEGSGASI